jgi:hypothetical protein
MASRWHFGLRHFAFILGIMCHPSANMGSQLNAIFNFTTSGG